MKKHSERRHLVFSERNVASLPVRKRQYVVWDGGSGRGAGEVVRGLHILVSPMGAKSYRSMFYFPGSGKSFSRHLGRVGELSLAAAREQCRRDRASARCGIDPRANSPTTGLALHERIAGKYASFAEQGITPSTYLYRHYASAGDLLYAGISLMILKRTAGHLRDAYWREQIALIVIEPFTTREQALDAEYEAIRTEFPKYNKIYNGRRQPFQELAQLRHRAQITEDVGERREIRRTYKRLTTDQHQMMVTPRYRVKHQHDH